ncbi:DUF1499 domain-containing protein [Pararhodospirillum oryzae]|uniref:Uncharacterized protein n=1 Tax=Pararhodospirillum oryzae TaxID=478448 RepID=A0A512H3D3_9PROT|nr:DUF1499 domain-containing protein [Pararhodospirillum oryzae]GEO79964.1 hypothetical protein ROR02_00950 [Pararhodospirillum oryzae]
MNRVLVVVLGLALVGLGAFGWAASTGRPLPTADLFPDPSPLPLDVLDAPEAVAGTPQALACPPEACADGEPDVESPVFALTPAALFTLARSTFTAQPLVTVLDEDQAAGRLDLVQRTPILGFPEVIRVQVVPVEPAIAGEASGETQASGASVFLLSRSREGAWDLGDNGARVRLWLGALERASRSQ